MDPSPHKSAARRNSSSSASMDGQRTPVNPPAARAGPGGPPGGPSGGGEPPYTHGFFDKDEASSRARKAYIGATVGNTLSLVFVIWAIFAIYWGSTWKGRTGAHNIHGWIVDFDGGSVGQAVTQAFLGATGPKTSMTWKVAPASKFPNGAADLQHAVLEQHIWAIVAINSGASQKLSNALSSADASYNGTSAVTAYAVQARNENAYRDIIAATIQGVMTGASTAFASQQARSLADSSSLPNLLRQAPQLLLLPVSYTIDNVRPFDVPVATAVDFVGLIYLMIISFNAVLGGVGIRLATGIERRLTTRSLIILRIVVPTVVYFILSLAISLLSKFFQVPFDRKFGPGGFVVFWMLSWIAMLALGYALEAVVTIVGMKFIGYFLVLWIIVNVSVCYYPVEILPTIYRYGFAAPFYNVNTGIRTIVFGTKNKLGENFGVLFAWIAISLITLPLAQWLTRRSDIAAANARAGPAPVSQSPVDRDSEKDVRREEA